MRAAGPFILGACAAIVLSTAVFAGDSGVPQRPAKSAGEVALISFSNSRETPPLLYAVPQLSSTLVNMLELRIMPRTLVTSDGRVVTDELFAVIETNSGELLLDNTVDTVSQIAVSSPSKSRMQVERVSKEPYCHERCDQDLYSCLDWCDPRGDSCELCYTWYDDCLAECPDVCTDPRSVTTHTTRTPVGYTYYSSSCRSQYGSTTLWDNISIRYRVDNWERTVNCDGSYSDRWLSSHDTYVNCWTNSGQYCSYSVGAPPSPRC